MKPVPGSYDNGSTVDNEDEILASFQSRSREVYKNNRHDKNLPYGDSPREVFDWFYSSEHTLGTLIFIHGGYWQFCSKEDFAFIAPAPLARGFDVVLVEYSQAPAASLDDICRQVGAALNAIQRRLPPRRHQPVYLCGHSAGGHLAAYWQGHAAVDAVLPISGIFELEPLLTTYVNRALQLTAQQISQLSPARAITPHIKPMTLFYGAAELPELIGQSRHYHAALREQGLQAGLCAVAGANHYTILDALFAADGALLRQLGNHEELQHAQGH
ncbi:Alpha/beta hydrolase family [Serratia entomophila]|uniref:alpha/beta hydrolase n=1 Tax=Serratia entomophila TaxID=42906 RepID=UPI002177E207|nr:alpha/beta hydrolase [Serratia entomophila]CAI0737614.1 Alpha/beta hydrolase family [Serratia entomophila]CAI1575864.1 Alpha/beta hydrolase family [Serratia entomophila]CAI1607207.1 Alpha/beta hydrolase family [Serratia entomophila]CAI1612642.1 Alpha/beta hydrolase family [Serratia entomophila]CAI1949449.1 Alpha/beta hydrolase family [Serratia entomophila]